MHASRRRVPYTKDQVKDAPGVDPDGHLEPGEEERLYRHYASEGQGRHAADTSAPSGVYTGDDGLAAGTAYSEGTQGTVGRDTSGPSTDDAMTRSEQRLNVGTEQQEAGRARLRKYVTTENVTQTVPVQREEVRLEREPITDENRPAAMDGPDLSEEEHEVTLHQERPVVEKETVPVERVRLDKETRTDQETVSGKVAKEHIDTEGIDEGRQP